MTLPEVYVAAGSNLRPVGALRFARRRLIARFPDLRLSPVFGSPDVTGSGPDYLNAVFAFTTGLSPGALREVLRAVEANAGRRRDRPGECTLDLDVLLHVAPAGDARAATAHPDLLRRDDLLAAMAALAPALTHPQDGRTMAALHAARGGAGEGLRCLGDLSSLPPD